ncbi:MAG TPA: hypothetical protein VGR54_03270 [Nitrosopumilaceae archaeon]|nr:hypothetical protein [Nitrosopumilaceae archaeon]
MKNTKDSLFLVGLIIAITGAFIFPVQAFSQEDYNIPSWIKENSKWWSEGKISTHEYISGLQYLISKGILKIPLGMDTNDTGIGNNNAQSFIVHIVADKEYVFYTFLKFNNLSQIIYNPSQDPNNALFTYSGPQFQLESLTSADNKDFYNLISNYLKHRSSIVPYDINIDILTRDGFIIETLQYAKCTPSSYSVYTNDDSSQYRLAHKDAPEIREDTNFVCAGYHIAVP